MKFYLILIYLVYDRALIKFEMKALKYRMSLLCFKNPCSPFKICYLESLLDYKNLLNLSIWKYECNQSIQINETEPNGWIYLKQLGHFFDCFGRNNTNSPFRLLLHHHLNSYPKMTNFVTCLTLNFKYS